MVEDVVQLRKDRCVVCHGSNVVQSVAPNRWMASAHGRCAFAPLRSVTQVRYRVFDNVDVTYGVILRRQHRVVGRQRGIGHGHLPPGGRRVSDRPVVILAHGGSFLQEATMGSMWCRFARISPAWATSPRPSATGWASTTCLIWRRRFKSRCFGGCTTPKRPYATSERRMPKTATHGGLTQSHCAWRVFCGAFIALHAAYIDDMEEVPDIIDLSQPGLGGGLEGLSGNQGILPKSCPSSTFPVPSEMRTGLPRAMFRGEHPWNVDGTVPYGTGTISLLGVNVTQVDGSWPVHIRAEDGIGPPLCHLRGRGTCATYEQATCTTI